MAQTANLATRVNPFTIPRGRLERARTPAAAVLEHDFDFSARQFTDRVTGVRMDRPAFLVGDPIRPAIVEGDGVTDHLEVAVPTDMFAIAPVEPYTVLLECGANTMFGIHVMIESGTGASGDVGWAIATLSNRPTLFTSFDGTTLDILSAPGGDKNRWPKDGGTIGFVKDGTTLTLYVNGSFSKKKTNANAGTHVTTGMLSLLATGIGSRYYPGTVNRFRMWRGALHDVLVDPQTYTQLGSDS